MKCALAAMGFIDGDIQYNKSVIIDIMKKYSDTADIVIFGEAFLQGFYCADFNVEHDFYFVWRKGSIFGGEYKEIFKQLKDKE